MMKAFARAVPLVIGLAAAAAAPVLAHEGHAGDHGWLAGALQPLLSVDHFLAGTFVALVLSLGLARLARRKGVVEGREGS